MNGKSDVDRQFEQMFGFASSTKPTPAPKRKPKTPQVDEDALERAAQAVQGAVASHTGKRRPVKMWRPVAREALGLAKMTQTTWEAVLRMGVAKELFRVDKTSLSFAILAPMGLPEPEEPPAVPTRKTPRKLRGPQPKPDPFTPPTRMDCGHWSFWRRGKGCHACDLKIPPDHVFLYEKFGTLIPGRQRRSAEYRTGFCCDDEGHYIGGVENNCRTGSPDDRRCPPHRKIEVS